MECKEISIMKKQRMRPGAPLLQLRPTVARTGPDNSQILITDPALQTNKAPMSNQEQAGAVSIPRDKSHTQHPLSVIKRYRRDGSRNRKLSCVIPTGSSQLPTKRLDPFHCEMFH